jgi:hypothetical protein
MPIYKYEILSTKYETNPNNKNPNDKNTNAMRDTLV